MSRGFLATLGPLLIATVAIGQVPTSSPPPTALRQLDAPPVFRDATPSPTPEVYLRPGRVYQSPPATQPRGPASEAFVLANRQRAARGLGPLSFDGNLTAVARAKVARAARARIKGHLGGSLGGANKEGVGFSTNRKAMACYLYTAPAGTPAGIAMARGSDGYYTCLLIRHNGYLPSGATNSGPIRRTVPNIRRRIFRR